MRMNPMIRKELLVNVRSSRIVILMVIFNGLLAVIGLLAFNQVIDDAKIYGQIDYNMITALYIWLVVFEALLLAFIVPALTAGVISGERERQTLDILLTSTLSPWSIVSGKLISCILSVILLICSSVPVLSLIYVFGGIGLWEMLQTVLMLVYLVFFVGCIGIFCSSVFKKTTSATVTSYGMMLFIGLGTFILALLLSFFSSYPYDSDHYVLIMLINPAVTMAFLIMGQLGDSTGMILYGGVMEFITEHWIPISLLVQVAMLALLLKIATGRVDPLRKGRRA